MEQLPHAVAVLLGLFSSAVIGFIKKKIKSTNWRFVLAIVLSGAVGVISAFIAKVEFDPANISIWTAQVIAYSQLAYATWKNLFKK